MDKDIVNRFAKNAKIIDIAKNIDIMSLWKYGHAAELKYSMENYKFDDDTFQRIYDLAEKLWLKDSSQACLSFFIERLCELVQNGESINELGKRNKWEVLELIEN